MNALRVFDITFPGSSPAGGDRHWERQISGLFGDLCSTFHDANCALNLFTESHAAFLAPGQFGSRTATLELQQRLREQREAGPSRPWTFDDRQASDFDIQVTAKRQYWAEGNQPQTFVSSTLFIHARAFLYAVDLFGKLLQVLAGKPGVPAGAASACDAFASAFPDVREIRNSAQHQEARSQGLGTGNKPIQLQPVNNGALQGNILVIGGFLRDTKFGNTLGDGRFAEVDVSPQSMASLQAIFQQLLDSFQWSGFPAHYPD